MVSISSSAVIKYIYVKKRKINSMLLKEIIGKNVSIRTGIATLRDVKAKVLDASDNCLKLEEKDGSIVYMPLVHCSQIRVEE